MIEVKLTRGEAAALIAAVENMRGGWSPEAEADSNRGANAIQDALNVADLERGAA